MESKFENCWFLTGPTASGKTLVGLELANQIDAEIISLDSMAVYREMDIGTAKPNAEQTAHVPHHLINIVDPNEDFSVAAYIEAAAECVQGIESRGKQALFVGGTPLYLKTLLRGMFEGPPADWEFREQVEREIEEVGLDALHARLAQVDPLSAEKLPAGDVRRIVRALEVYKITGKPISHWQLQFDEGRAAEDCRVFVLDWPRPTLHQRIEQRVDQMFERGLIEEVRQIVSKYTTLSRTAMQAVGYREIIEWLEAESDRDSGDATGVSLDLTIERVKTRTRRFAKRQCTWFRSLSECRFIPRTDEDSSVSVADEIAALGRQVGA